jgi:hypothetical protein
MKSAKLSAIAFSLLISFGLASGCSAADSQPRWRATLPDGSIFFPYSWCLAFKVLRAGPHTIPRGSIRTKTDKADLDVKVKVEYVLRQGTEYERLDTRKVPVVRAGKSITFCLSKQSDLDLKQYIDSVKTRKQVWAFSTWWPGDSDRLFFNVESHFEPFRNQEFSKTDLKELAADLAKTITDPEDAKHPIEKYLAERWPENRIREFCHRDNRLIMRGASPDPGQFVYDCPGESYLQGLLYPNSGLGKVMWMAKTVKKIPIRYGLVVKHGKSVWQLEESQFELGSSFSDDDALRKRIHDTLSDAWVKSFFDHRRPPRAENNEGGQRIYSSTPLCHLSPDWKAFTIEKGNIGQAVAVSCGTSSGRLTALLDGNKEIQTVTLNGKDDEDWIEALVDANQVRSNLYDKARVFSEPLELREIRDAGLPIMRPAVDLLRTKRILEYTKIVDDEQEL